MKRVKVCGENSVTKECLTEETLNALIILV